MTKTIVKNLIIFLSLVVFSCSPQNNEQRQIRIVDLQGNPRPVQTRVPELNAQILDSQGKLQQEETHFKSNSPIKVAPVAKFPRKTTEQIVEKDISKNKYADPETKSANLASEAISKLPVDPAKTQAAESSIALDAGAKEPEIEYDLSDESRVKEKSVALREVEKSPENKVLNKISAKETPKKSSGYRLSKPSDETLPQSSEKNKIEHISKKGIFVQTGSFGNENNAKNSLKAMQKFAKGSIEESKKSDDSTIYRVLLGPFPDKQKANAIVNKIKNSGADAIIVRN